MKSFEVGVITLAAVLAIGSTVAYSEWGFCPAGCDCETIKAGTAPCATNVTKCAGVVPQLVNGVLRCGGATDVEPDWSKGCKENKEYVIELDEYWYGETNCDEPNTNCSRPTNCEVVNGKCQQPAIPNYGNWSQAKKPTEVGCI